MDVITYPYILVNFWFFLLLSFMQYYEILYPGWLDLGPLLLTWVNFNPSMDE